MGEVSGLPLEIVDFLAHSHPTMWFYRENLGGKCLNAKLRFVAGLPKNKSFGNGKSNPIIARPICYVSRFHVRLHVPNVALCRHRIRL